MWQTVTISRRFRNLLKQTYPRLKENKPLWNMLAYLMFSTSTDKDTGWLVLPAKVIAEMHGKSNLFKHHNYFSQLLNYFEHNVFPLEVARWDDYLRTDWGTAIEYPEFTLKTTQELLPLLDMFRNREVELDLSLEELDVFTSLLGQTHQTNVA